MPPSPSLSFPQTPVVSKREKIFLQTDYGADLSLPTCNFIVHDQTVTSCRFQCSLLRYTRKFSLMRKKETATKQTNKRDVETSNERVYAVCMGRPE